MFLKKNIIFVGLLIITILLTTGCEWPNCMKKKCTSCPMESKKETPIILENDSNTNNNNLDESEFSSQLLSEENEK